jgi:hypothetical protein
MPEQVAAEFVKFLAAERRAGRAAAAVRTAPEGRVFKGVVVGARSANQLVRSAARQAAGLFRPSKHAEVVWVEGGNELLVVISEITVTYGTGLVRIGIPVRCDQSGPAVVEVGFVVGSAVRPAGLYASTSQTPTGPELVVRAWGPALIAFAWQCLLGLATGVAAACGKDQRGNLLVPVELSASARGIAIVPMARHRLVGAGALATKGTRA